jgi:murein DD-endopeptidase MepM/ murein hydrolase activator NlpD
LKRALKKRVKAVLNNTPNSDDAPVEQLNVINPRVNRRVRTKAAMIGLAISMGATSLLVTRQSDQAQAAAPVGSQKATSSIPAAPDTDVKFASKKLEYRAVSSASVPENPVIVEPTAVSQVPGLEAKWQVAANGMSVTVPVSETLSQTPANYKNSIYLKSKLAQGLSNTSANTDLQTVNKLSETTQKFSSADGITGGRNSSQTAQSQAAATSDATDGKINAQLKAQQEFALNRLQDKSNRLRKSLAELRSGESKTLSQAGIELAQPMTIAEKTVIAQSEIVIDASKANLISRLKQKQETSTSVPQATTPAPATRPTVIASAPTPYEVKPGDTLAAIANHHGTSVSELVKANSLTNPNQLQISQKLIIPIAQVDATVSVKPSFRESSVTANVPTSPLNTAGVNLNLPVASQLPVIDDNSSIFVPTPTTANNRIQAKTNIAPGTSSNTAASRGIGGDISPTAFAEIQLPKKPPQKVARAKNERLQSLQAEIQRLQARYRAQQSGNLVVSAATENNSVAAVQIPVSSPNNLSPVSNFASQPSNLAITIPVPTPIGSTSYSTQPIKQQFRATRPTNEPVNPEFLPNLGPATQWTPSRSPSSTKIATPPVGVNSYDSLGKMRGTTVSPQLPIPPLAAVDQYLPRSIDEAIPPPSTSSVAFSWPAKGVLTSGYGWRWGRMHKGIDIANSTGTPIVASAEGTVEKAGWNSGGYGKLVEIRHPDGSLTRYAHNSKILVQPGQQVNQGSTIALMGTTGHSTGPHSHFEIHPSGKGAVNPIAMLPQERL